MDLDRRQEQPHLSPDDMVEVGPAYWQELPSGETVASLPQQVVSRESPDLTTVEITPD